jgi:hypothetical protein
MGQRPVFYGRLSKDRFNLIDYSKKLGLLYGWGDRCDNTEAAIFLAVWLVDGSLRTSPAKLAISTPVLRLLLEA